MRRFEVFRKGTTPHSARVQQPSSLKMSAPCNMAHRSIMGQSCMLNLEARTVQDLIWKH